MSQSTLFSSIIICVIAYIIALFAATIAINFLPDSVSLFWRGAIGDVVATVAVYGFSIAFRNSSLYDPYWSVAPPTIALYWLMSSWLEPTAAHWFCIAVIMFWAIRLTLNWLRGWEGLKHEDWRYVMLEKKNPSLYWLTNFGGIHMFPTVMVFLGMIPVYFLMAGELELNALVLAGGVICIIATVIEWVADEQMRAFRKTAVKGSFIDSGLWRYSRHPNYFGEITFWLGLWVMALGLDLGLWWTGIGWMGMLLMFLLASIPMMEKKNKHSKKGFEEYVRKVSVLVPWFRKE